MVENLGKNDPYNKMNTAKDDIRPDYLPRNKNEVRNDEAAEDLRRVESGASDSAPTKASDNLVGARENEEAANGFYRSSGRGEKKKGKGKGKGKGLLKRKGPMGLIIGLILGTGGLLGGAQLFQPFSLIEQFRETFNSMHVSASTRSNALLRYQMDGTGVKNPIKSKLFGSDKFKISNRQASKLAKSGIEYDDSTFKDANGKAIGVLKYDDGSGEIKIVTATDADAAKLNDIGLSRFDSDGVKYASADSFKNLYEADDGFFRSYNDGSRTWRGSIANWFGSLTDKFISNNKLTRNRFKNFRQDVEENGDNPRAAAIDIMAKNADEIKEGDVRTVTDGEEVDGQRADVDYEYDEDGNKIGTKSKIDSSPEVTARADLDSEAEVKAKLEEVGDKYSGGSKVGGAFSKVANYGCLAVNFMGGVTLLVTASEALQVINLVTSYFEAIDKTKAGDGDNSPIMTLTSALNEQKTSSYTELEASGTSTASVTESGISSLSSKTTTQTKSAMEAEGIVSLYDNTPVNTSDPSVKSFNVAGNIKRVFWGLGASMGLFKTCAVTKLLANAVTAVSGALEVIGCLAGIAGTPFTFGASAAGCGPLIGDLTVGLIASVGVSVLIAGIISTITPTISSMLTRNLITNLGGEDLGNALTSGANMYLGNAHRGNGGSLAMLEDYKAYETTHQQIIADNAKYERMTRDPFDSSSKYTFLGTLLTQMSSFVSVGSLFDVVSSTSSAVSSSLIALTPAASAYNINTSIIKEEEYADTCPYLASIGAVGDAFCNPYAITDTSTISYDPAEVTEKLDDNFLDETTEDGNVKIKGNSDLAKYILFCDNRESSFGIADQNIANQVTKFATVDTDSTAFNNVTNSAIGAVPAVGDIIDVINNKIALDNAGYISGESCVAGNNASGSESPTWETAKYYQRFIEDQSLMESMGIINKSAVTAFLDEYYEQNPLDNSYEGILARYSGLTKDTVVALLDTIDYYNYIADYDATTRYAFGAPVVEEPKEILFDNENEVAKNTYIILLNEITFADVRNRNFVV